MIPLSAAVSGEFTWSKIPHSRNYELKWNGEVAGTLQHPGFWSANFVAETEHGRWTFRRSGFLGAGAEIVDAASEHLLATFKSAWSGRGILTFADGQVFHLECKGWWHPVWSVYEADGKPVLHLHTREQTVDVEPDADIPGSRLSLLVLFAWYRVLQAEEDAASAATVAA